LHETRKMRRVGGVIVRTVAKRFGIAVKALVTIVATVVIIRTIVIVIVL
jgi:hypothetical protein